jgi:hypothetical protein
MRKIAIPGYRLKDGRLVKCIKNLDASAKARRRGGSKKITVKRKGAQTPL